MPKEGVPGVCGPGEGAGTWAEGSGDRTVADECSICVDLSRWPADGCVGRIKPYVDVIVCDGGTYSWRNAFGKGIVGGTADTGEDDGARRVEKEASKIKIIIIMIIDPHSIWQPVSEGNNCRTGQKWGLNLNNIFLYFSVYL